MVSAGHRQLPRAAKAKPIVSLPECYQPLLSQTQSLLTRLGLKQQTKAEQDLFQTPRCQSKMHPSKGHMALASLKTQCFRDGKALAFGAGVLPVTQRWASDLP